MPGTPDHAEQAFLHDLLQNPADGWPRFLDRFSGVILRLLARRFRNSDDQMDAYLFVCEKLAAGNMERIRKYQSSPPGERAAFTIWLAAVTRNLSVDWYRSVHGRRMLPAAVARRPEPDQVIFRYVFWEGRTCAETVELLGNHGFRDMTLVQVQATVGALHDELPVTSLWAAQLEQGEGRGMLSLDVAPGETGMNPVPDPRAPGPSPAAQYDQDRAREELERAMSGLSEEDRLLLSLRFQENLKAREIAAIAGIESEGSVYQRLRTLLERLRRELRLDGREFLNRLAPETT